MDWKEILRPTSSKIILALLLLIVFTLIFGIPVKLFPSCAVGEKCPLITEFKSISQLAASREFIGKGIWLHWNIYVAELAVAYLISSFAIHFLNFKSQP